MTGTMVNTVAMLGTQLKLKAGQAVTLEEAYNLPAPQRDNLYASPIDGSWGEDSICVERADVTIDS